MLRKVLLICTSLCASLFIASATQAQVKTSSLSMNKPTSVKLIPQCQNMFNVADMLVRDAERQPGTHTQVSRLKNKK